MWKNKKGAALMQVLLISIILAGMAVMLLRAGLSRMSSARRTRRAVSAEMLIESCMAEVTANWALKNSAAFDRDLTGWDNDGVPYMYREGDSFVYEDTIKHEEHVCTYAGLGTVKAFWEQELDTKEWHMVYTVELE